MNLLGVLATETGELLRPLLRTREDPRALGLLLSGRGWRLDLRVIDIAALDQALDAALAAAESLAQGLDTEDLAQMVNAIDQLSSLSTSIQPCIDAFGAALPAGAPATVAAALAQDIRDDLVLRYLGTRTPQLYDALSMLGIIATATCDPLAVGSGANAIEVRAAVARSELRWAQVPAVLRDPPAALAALYLAGYDPAGGGDWLVNQRDARWFVNAVRDRLAGPFARLGGVLRGGADSLVDAHRDPATERATRTLIGQLRVPLPPGSAAPSQLVTADVLVLGPSDVGALGRSGPGLEVRTTGLATLSAAAGDWTIALTVGGSPGRFFVSGSEFIPENNGASLEASLEATWGTAGQPAIVIGADRGTRLEVGAVVLRLFSNLSASSVDAGAGVSIDNAALVVSAGDGDSFLTALMPAEDLRLSIDLGVAWSRLDGVVLEGGGGLSIRLPIGLELFGVVSVPYLDLGLVAEDEALAFQAGATLIVSLGPFGFTIENTGIQIEAAFPANRDGNLGPLDLALAWKPPTGAGIAVDLAGLVTGGGFLLIDQQAGTYAGVLDLRFIAVGITAVGIVDTKLPGGGWSLFLALYIGVPTIPLGFGFSLNGVGGLAGINRTLDVPALQSAVRSGALDSLLFPEDPVEQAPIIIEQLQSIFPSAEGRYVFGPVLKIGWGVPTLIEAEVGIVLSVPDPVTVALIGSVSSVLPTPDLDLVALHLDVAGVIDTAAATLSIDSSLHDSHIVGFALAGDMALRASFGSQPSFLLALGGFHPGFDQPAGFPTLARLSLGIDAGDFLDIRFESYFAIASNSVQFGAAFELTAEVEGFGINGGAEFDALIKFAPLVLDTQVGFHIAVTGAGVDLASAWIDARLLGPNPWHVLGTATIKVLGLSQSVSVNQTIGASVPEPPPPADDVLGSLRAALALPEAWSVGEPGGASVILASQEAAARELVVAPDSRLGVSQRVVPLGITIDRAEPLAILGGFDTFDIVPASGLESTGDLSDWFAPSSYLALGPQEKLSAPSFERLKSGVEFGGGDPKAGTARRVTLEYEQILRDPNLGDESTHLLRWDLESDPRAAVIASAAVVPTSGAFSIEPDEQPVSVRSARFVAADRLTGATYGTEWSWTATRASGAGRRADTIVVPSWEVPA